MQSHSTAVTASTLPAHEPFGARPGDHSSGVGALPGNQSEADVALLPEESAHPQFDSGAIATSGQVGLKPSEEASGNEAAFGQARNMAGVGALVGDRSESGVARLPDERSKDASDFAPVGAVTGSRDEQGKQSVEPSTTNAADKGPAPAQDSSAHEAAKKEMGDSGHKGLPNQVSARFNFVQAIKRTGGMAGQHQLPGDPGTGPVAAETQRGQASSLQADLCHATLRPRPHALGGDRARWGGVPLNGDCARAELDTDTNVREVRSAPRVLSARPTLPISRRALIWFTSMRRTPC